MCIKCDTTFAGGCFVKNESKSELIHIRIEPEIKNKSEQIFKRLGVNTSYAVSKFLSQVILKEGFPFELQLPKQNNNEYVALAKIIESTVKQTIARIMNKTGAESKREVVDFI